MPGKRQNKTPAFTTEDERNARGTTSLRSGLGPKPLRTSNNALCCNGQSRRALTESAWARLSGAMFSQGQPVPFQRMGTLCEADGGILFPS